MKNTIILIFLYCVQLSAACTLTLTSPTSSQVVTGFAGAGNPRPFTFSVTKSGCPTLAYLQYFVDGYPARNPGWGAPYNDLLAPFYEQGIAPFAPYSMPWNTYWFADGSHTASAQALDINFNVIASSSTVKFSIGNLWPVKCRDGTAPRGELSASDVNKGILPLTWKITGSCAPDDIKVSIFVDGITQHFNGSWGGMPSTFTAHVDETQFQNGSHNVCFSWLDKTHFTNSGAGPIESAGEQCLPLTFSNGTLPSEVRTACRDCYMLLGGTQALTPVLYNTDGTTASPPAFDYWTTSNVVTLNPTTSVVAAAGSCPANGTGLPCSAQVLVMAETQHCSDLTAVFGTAQYWSATCPFKMSQLGNLVHIKGGKGWTPGVYQITNVDLRANVIQLKDRNGNNPTCCISGGNFSTGPTTTLNILPWTTQNVSCFGSDTAIHTGPNPNCIYMNEAFAGGAYLPDHSSVPYNFLGHAGAGPYAEFDSGGFNTWEVTLLGISVCADWQGKSLSAFTRDISNYVDGLSYGLSRMPRFSHFLYGVADATMDNTTDLWTCSHGTPAQWSPPIIAAALNTINASGYRVLGVNLRDEVDSSWGYRPMAGPIRPGGANSWLTSITATSGRCSVNGSGISINAAAQFIIHGSSTAALNTPPGGDPYHITSSFLGGKSFTFNCPRVNNGTYNDHGLTIEPLAADGYKQNGNTSYVGYDALANIRSQAASQSYHTPITAAPKAIAGCAAFHNWLGNGSDGPIGDLRQFGQFADFYEDLSQYQPFLVSRNSIRWYFAGSYSPGGYNRQEWGCYNPSLPLTDITHGNEAIQGNQGYAAPGGVANIFGSRMTFDSPGHGLVNVVPGNTTLAVSGNSNSALNTTYYVLEILSPTELRVALQGTDFASSCSGGTCTCPGATLSFTRSGYVVSSSGMTAIGGAQPYKFYTGNGTHFAGNGFGQSFNLAAADPNLPKHRGEIFAVNCHGNTVFDSNTYVYAPTNLSVPSWLPGSNIYWELPNGSGKGGTAIVRPDNSSNCGRAWCARPQEASPEVGYEAYMAAAIANATGFRAYKFGGSQSYSYIDGWGFTGNYDVSLINPKDPLMGDSFMWPHFQNAGQVGLFHADSEAGRLLTRWQSLFLQSRCNSPDYGWVFDSMCRTGSNGNALLIANTTNWTQTGAFDLTPILNGQNIIENISGAHGENVITVLPASTKLRTVTLKEGQSLAFIAATVFEGTLNEPIFQPGGTGTFGDCPTGTDSISIRWGYNPYLLDSTTSNVQSFTSFPATIPADKNYGPVYGRILCVSASRGVLSTSDVQTF